jgi:hypothetical protein
MQQVKLKPRIVEKEPVLMQMEYHLTLVSVQVKNPKAHNSKMTWISSNTRILRLQKSLLELFQLEHVQNLSIPLQLKLLQNLVEKVPRTLNGQWLISHQTSLLAPLKENASKLLQLIQKPTLSTDLEKDTTLIQTVEILDVFSKSLSSALKFTSSELHM